MMKKRRGDPTAVKVFRAWTEQGVRPDYHRKMQNYVRVNWPTLGRALDELAREKKGLGK